MDLIEALSDRFAFQQSLYRETVDALAPPLAAAAEILAQTVLSGHRLWIVSGPGTHYLAAHFIERLWYGLERERPPFAAVHLPAATTPPPHGQPLDVLAQPGDCVMILLDHEPSETIRAAMRTALEAGSPLIVIGHDPDEHIWSQLRGGDVPVALPELPPAQQDELLLFLLNALTETWEQLLFGELV